MSEAQNIDIEELRVTYKTWLFSRKIEWQQVQLKDLPQKISRQSRVHLQTGNDAIYVIPIFEDATGEKYYWMILDIESKNHDDIAANIESAQVFLLWLAEKGLTQEMKIMLTGRGFRFVWPMLVPPEYVKGFLRWIRDRDFPFIDASPQLKRGHVRVLGYRNNRRQGLPPKNVHVHLLLNIHELTSLTDIEYRRLVKGMIPASRYMEWLVGLLPDRFIPNEWIALFEYYQQKSLLESSIVAIGLQSSRFQKPNLVKKWEQINEFLTAQGIEKREGQAGDQTIVRLSECPVCGRKDGSPYLTSSGILKDFHANSCPAGEMHQDGKWSGRIKGLPPSKWVEGYRGAIEDHHTGTPEGEASNTIEEARAAVQEAVDGDADLLIKMTPGAGKSYTTVKTILPRCEKELAVYAVPTKALAAEIYRTVREYAQQDGIETRLLLGRSGETKTHPATCYKMDKVIEVLKRGFTPGLLVCPDCVHCRRDL
jgi:hypothetical protein